jgi:aspartate-semialdehyde dehydrogenase
MSSPYRKNPSSSKQPMDLEYINRGLNQNQQMAVYVPPEELRIQNGMLQRQETEEMHLGRIRKSLTAFLSFQLCLSITDILKGIAVQVTVMRTGTRLH